MKRTTLATLICLLLLAGCLPLIPTPSGGDAPAATWIPTLTPTTTPFPDLVTPESAALPEFNLIANVDEFTFDDATQLVFQPGGYWWLLSRTYALRWDGETWLNVVEDQPGVIGIDSQGRLWVQPSTPDQIAYWQAGTWTQFSREQGWVETGFMNASEGGASLLTGMYGDLYLLAGNHIDYFDDHNWRTLSLTDMGFSADSLDNPPSTLSALYLPQSEELWVGRCSSAAVEDSSLRYYDNLSWNAVTMPQLDPCITFIQPGINNDLWIGSNTGLWRYYLDTEEWQYFPSPALPTTEGWQRQYPIQMDLDGNGSPWIVTTVCGGASCGLATGLYMLDLAGESWQEALPIHTTFTVERVQYDPINNHMLVIGGGIITDLTTRVSHFPVNGFEGWALSPANEGQLYLVGIYLDQITIMEYHR